MVTRYPRPGYGYGIIQVDIDLMGSLVPHATIDDTTTQGELRGQGFLDQCKQALLLPEDYEVLGIYLRPFWFAWDILVEAVGLPLPPRDEELRKVIPIYRANKDGVRMLERIEVAKNHYEILRID